MSTDSVLDRRSLSLRDVLMLLGLGAGLLASYVAQDRRLTRLETKVDALIAVR